MSRKRCEVIVNLDLHPKKGGLFGNHLLLSQAQAKAQAQAQAKAQAQARNMVELDLSEREKKIVERLSIGE